MSYNIPIFADSPAVQNYVGPSGLIITDLIGYLNQENLINLDAIEKKEKRKILILVYIICYSSRCSSQQGDYWAGKARRPTAACTSLTCCHHISPTGQIILLQE